MKGRGGLTLKKLRLVHIKIYLILMMHHRNTHLTLVESVDTKQATLALSQEQSNHLVWHSSSLESVGCIYGFQIEPHAQPCAQAGRAFGAPLSCTTRASPNSQAVLISYLIAVLRFVSSRAACIVREGEGLLNYKRSCWAFARTLMKDARRGLIR